MALHRNLSDIPLLYLDLDGVLHPDHVVLSRKCGLILRAEGHLMMHAGALEAELRSYPEVRIVLSTSWVRVLGFSRTMKRLPEGIRGRVIGATWHSTMNTDRIPWPYVTTSTNRFDEATRYQQISWHVERHQVREWLAIDDLHSGCQSWPAEHQHRLVLTNSQRGLGCAQALADLHRKLQQAFRRQAKEQE